MSPHHAPVGPFPEGTDPEAYDRLRRRVLWSMPAGIYLLGSVADGRRNLMTCNWVTQLATTPKTVGAAIEGAALSAELVSAGGVFTVSLLARADRPLARKFAKPANDDRGARTLNGVAYHDGSMTGAPIVDAALAWLECRVTGTHDLGSHRLFLGEVVGAGAPAGEGPLEVLRMEDTRMSYGG